MNHDMHATQASLLYIGLNRASSYPGMSVCMQHEQLLYIDDQSSSILIGSHNHGQPLNLHSFLIATKLEYHTSKSQRPIAFEN